MHEIKLGRFSFQLPESDEELSQTMCLHLIECHLEATDEDIKTLFLMKTVGRRVALLKRLNEVQLAQLVTLLDWMTADHLPALPLVKSIKVKGITYHAPRASMKLMSGIEFSMLDMYYNLLNENPENPEKLDDLCAVYFRELEDGKRCPLEEEGIEKRKQLFKNIDPREKLSALFYMSANKNMLAKKFKMIFQGGGSGKDPLGWAGTFIAIAETGIIGDLAKVKDTPITEICMILVKKHYDKIDLEKS